MSIKVIDSSWLINKNLRYFCALTILVVIESFLHLEASNSEKGFSMPVMFVGYLLCILMDFTLQRSGMLNNLQRSKLHLFSVRLSKFAILKLNRIWQIWHYIKAKFFTDFIFRESESKQLSSLAPSYIIR